jgi:predicted PurR-regulated permease PerM
VFSPSHSSRLVHRRTGKIIVVALLAVLVIAAIGAAILGIIALLSSGSDNLSVLLQKMAEVIETARSRLPAWALSSLPEEPAELKAAAAAWLREHAGQLRSIGQDVWRGPDPHPVRHGDRRHDRCQPRSRGYRVQPLG